MVFFPIISGTSHFKTPWQQSQEGSKTMRKNVFEREIKNLKFLAD
jgi:hypothetical protein